MLRRWNFLPARTALALAIGGGLLAFGSAALAVSALLAPGATIVVPATTAATEPTLAGVVELDNLVPFVIRSPAGALICEGKLQDRVVRSTSTNRLDFYYAIRDTNGSGGGGANSHRGFQRIAVARRISDRWPRHGTAAHCQAERGAGSRCVVYVHRSAGFLRKPPGVALHPDQDSCDGIPFGWFDADRCDHGSEYRGAHRQAVTMGPGSCVRGESNSH